MNIRDIAAAHRRCFWLDGGGAQEWAGSTSLIGWLDESDPSMSYSAARREVTLHHHGISEIVGDDPFTVLDDLMHQGGQWFGYFGYAARSDLPARPSSDVPDCVWMRPSHVHRAAGVGPDGVPAVPREVGPVPVTRTGSTRGSVTEQSGDDVVRPDGPTSLAKT